MGVLLKGTIVRHISNVFKFSKSVGVAFTTQSVNANIARIAEMVWYGIDGISSEIHRFSSIHI